MEIAEVIASGSAGAPGGVATLNSSGELVEKQLPSSVEIGSPPPTGVAATDTATVKAVLQAAKEVNGVAVFNKPGTYAINEELVRYYTVSIVIGPNTTFQAVAGFTGECLLTDSKTNQSKEQSITGGGHLDANNIAKHALWCRYFNHLVLGVKPKNSLEDDVILGDTSASGESTEPVIEPNFLIQRTAGSTPLGHYCLWAQRAGDGRMPGTVMTGQETGMRLDAGGWRGFGVHLVGAKYPMQVGIDDNGSNEWFGVNLDTMTPKEHTEAAGEVASTTITDPAILSQHLGRPVSGTNIPEESFVGTVTSGVSFTLVNKTGSAVKPTGAVSGITLAGVGIMRRVGATTVTGGQIYINPAYGTVDNGAYGIVFTPTSGTVNVDNFHAQGGEAGNYRVARAFTGNLTNVTWTGLVQVNVVTTLAAFSLPAESITTTEIAKEGVTGEKIAKEGVKAASLAKENIAGEKMVNNTVSGKQLKVNTPGAAKELAENTEYEGSETEAGTVYLSILLKAEATALEIISDGKPVYAFRKETLVAASLNLHLSFRIKQGGGTPGDRSGCCESFDDPGEWVEGAIACRDAGIRRSRSFAS